MSEDKIITRSYSLTESSIKSLEETVKRFKKTSRISISASKVIELAIFNLEGKTLEEIINPPPQAKYNKRYDSV